MRSSGTGCQNLRNNLSQRNQGLSENERSFSDSPVCVNIWHLLIFPRRSKTTAVCTCQRINLLKDKLRLLFHDAELADAVI